MDLLNAAKIVFKFDEGDGPRGREGYPYRDAKGLWTIGRGHLIGEYLEELKLSPAMIDALFFEDLEKFIINAKEIFGEEFFNGLELPRQIAILSLLFTLGKTKFLKFYDTIASIKIKDWEIAAKKILLTKWAADVDPRRIPDMGRDDRIAHMLRSGEFHPDYKL